MFEDKNANVLGALVSARARDEAVDQAQGEVEVIEREIMAALEKIGLNIDRLPCCYAMLAEVRERRADRLVHDRLQAVANALMAPAKPVYATGGTIPPSRNNDELIAAIKEVGAHVKRMTGNIETVTDGGNTMRTESVIGTSTAFDIATPAPGTPAYNAHNAIRTQA